MSRPTGLFIIIGALLLALSPRAKAQPPGGDFELPFKYEKGDRIELISVRQETENSVLKGKARTNATLEVIETDKSGFLFRWTTLETRPDHEAVDKLPAELLTQLQSVTKGLSLEYRVTTSGVMTEITNLPQTRNTLSEKASRIASQLVAKAETKQLGLNIAQVAQFYQRIPDAALVGLLGMEIAAFHAVSGKQLSDQHAVTVESRMNNPFGDGFLPATTTSTVERVDKSPGILHVRISGQPDLSSLIDEMSRSPAWLAQWFGVSPSNLPSPEELKRQLSQFTFTQDIDAWVEASSGHRREVRSKKIVSGPGKVLTTEISISIVTGDRKKDGTGEN